MPPGEVSGNDILALFRRANHDQEEWVYLTYHADRLAFLVNLIGVRLNEYSALPPRRVRVLDVGPHFLTSLLHRFFGDRIVLHTLGWENERLAPARIIAKHMSFDLNDAQDPDRWPCAEAYDIVVVAEVIEHLYTAPRLVLAFLASLLDDRGSLIVQTPNAVALRNRVKMLLGRNPFEAIREKRSNPGHFREYTGQELVTISERAGLECERLVYLDYWPTNFMARLVQRLNPHLRNGLTLVLKKRRPGGHTQP
jgi:trans-aconitate methyltransferase